MSAFTEAHTAALKTPPFQDASNRVGCVRDHTVQGASRIAVATIVTPKHDRAVATKASMSIDFLRDPEGCFF